VRLLVNSRDGKDLKAFFEPQAVAIFGSLKDGMGLGCGVIKNKLYFGFQGSSFPSTPQVATAGTESIFFY
jgi:hypothetical protein